MKAERERTLAGMVLGATILAWFGLLLLTFYVPRLSALWAELGTPLSPVQRLLLALCRLSGHNFVAVTAVLLAATGTAFWWRLQTSRRTRSSAHLS
jgi:type II secretory pathway component PulF